MSRNLRSRDKAGIVYINIQTNNYFPNSCRGRKPVLSPLEVSQPVAFTHARGIYATSRYINSRYNRTLLCSHFSLNASLKFFPPRVTFPAALSAVFWLWVLWGFFFHFWKISFNFTLFQLKSNSMGVKQELKRVRSTSHSKEQGEGTVHLHTAIFSNTSLRYNENHMRPS